MFDLSLPEMALLGAAAYFCFGRREFVRGSTYVGKVVGRSVVRIGHWRDTISQSLASESLASLHPELKKGFSGIMEAQNELRSATASPFASVQQLVMNRATKQGGSQDTNSSQVGFGSKAWEAGEREFIPRAQREIAAVSSEPIGRPVLVAPEESSVSKSEDANNNNNNKRVEKPTTEKVDGGADLILASIRQRQS